MTLKIIGIGGLYLLLVLIGQVFFKRTAATLATDSVGGFLGSLYTNPHLYIAFSAYLAAMMSWVWLLKYIDLSRVFPVVSAILLVAIPLVSVQFLAETLSIRYWMGVLCMFIGIALIASEMRVL